MSNEHVRQPDPWRGGFKLTPNPFSAFRNALLMAVIERRLPANDGVLLTDDELAGVEAYLRDIAKAMDAFVADSLGAIAAMRREPDFDPAIHQSVVSDALAGIIKGDA